MEGELRMSRKERERMRVLPRVERRDKAEGCGSPTGAELPADEAYLEEVSRRRGCGTCPPGKGKTVESRSTCRHRTIHGVRFRR